MKLSDSTANFAYSSAAMIDWTAAISPMIYWIIQLFFMTTLCYSL